MNKPDFSVSKTYFQRQSKDFYLKNQIDCRPMHRKKRSQVVFGSDTQAFEDKNSGEYETLVEHNKGTMLRNHKMLTY